MTDRKVVRSSRPKRVPIGTRNVLTFPERVGYKRRVVSDVGDRIKQFEAAGYTIVREDIVAGDPKAGSETKIGSAVNPRTGSETKGVLMEIRQEWYDEDQKAKQAEITRGERDMTRKLNQGGDGDYGSVKIE